MDTILHLGGVRFKMGCLDAYPKGAEVLLKLYRDGALPMSGKVPSEDVGDVLAYIASGDGAQQP